LGSASTPRRRLAEFEKQATLTENDRDRDIAESAAQLRVSKAEFDRRVRVAETEATAKAEVCQLELQREVEEYRSREQVERLRASDFAAADVAAEVAVRVAEGEATAKVRQSEGVAASLRAQAEGHAAALVTDAKANATATLAAAEAESEATKLRASAAYVEQQNIALGILRVREAEAEGLERLVEAAGGVANLSQYLMVRDGMLTDIAEHQANAVRGMQPKVSVWQTGTGGGGGDSSGMGVGGLSGTINDLARNGVPLLDGLREQYGIDFLKNWRGAPTDKHVRGV